MKEVNRAYELFLQRYSKKQIILTLCREFEIDEKTAEKYYIKAVEIFIGEGDKNE